MKKRLLAVLLVGTLCLSMLAGCSTSNKDKSGEYVISNDYVNVVTYKGLEAEEYSGVVTDTEINTYIEYIMNYSTEVPDESTVKYTINDLTDEMVKEISANDYNSIVDYKAYIKGVIEEQNKSYYEQNTKDTLFQQIVEASELKTYEKDRLQSYIDYTNDYYKEYAEYLELEFDTFYKDTMGLTSETEYNEFVEAESLKNLKTEYIIQAIAAAEKIEVTEEDINNQIKSYLSDSYFETEEDVLAYITRDEIKTNLQYYQVLNVIFDSAKFVKEVSKPENNETQTSETTSKSSDTSQEENNTQEPVVD